MQSSLISPTVEGTTACSWDTIIPFEPMWVGMKRVLKPRGVFVTTASQPFTSKLVCSNLAWFKYEWVWVKSMAGMFVHAKNRPLKRHENVLVFSSGVVNHKSLTENRMNYYPQIEFENPPYSKKHSSNEQTNDTNFGWRPSHVDYEVNDVTTRYPVTVLEIPNGNYDVEHPTQKPVDLYSYLIRTYTQPGDLILDFCAGSGTTAVAARQLNRRFIVGDSSPEYCALMERRLSMPYTPNMFETTLFQNDKTYQLSEAVP